MSSAPASRPSLNALNDILLDEGFTVAEPSDDNSSGAVILKLPPPSGTSAEDDATADVPWPIQAPDLSLLSDRTASAPTFPAGLLGPFWSEWCAASARDANAPIDYTIGTLLATVGALLGNVRWPDVEGVWEHPSVLWIGLVGNPSTAKSPGMRPVRKLITAVENARANAILDAGPQHRLKAFVAELTEREWRREIENTLATRTAKPDNGTVVEGLPVWPKDAQIPETPVQPVLHVVDATIEALITTSAGAPRGLLQFSDELAGWFGGFDRYRSKGVSADRPFWLKAFDGDPYSVIRKGSDLKNGVRAPVEIRHLSIGVIGSVQPDPLRRFLTNADDGLAHRFLWVWPERTTTFRIPRKNDAGVKADDDAARAAIFAMENLDRDREACARPPGEPKRVPCSPAATDLLEAYGQTILDRSQSVTPWYASTLNKAPGLALRLSLVLTFLRWSSEVDKPEPEEIDGSAMAAAIVLMEDYFLPQAERVRDCASVGEGESDARTLIALIRRLGTERVTGREVHRIATGRLADTRIRQAAFDILVDAGLLVEDFKREGKTPGRKKEMYRVHPKFYPS